MGEQELQAKEEKHDSKKRFQLTQLKMNVKTLLSIAVALIGFFIIYYIPEGTTADIRLTLAVTFVGIVLWITEIVSFGLTSIFVLLLYLFFNIVSVELAFSGFASGAVFLIVGGMMMAQGVHSTTLGHRVIYQILKYTGNNPGALLFGIIMIPNMLAIFIPATGVRTTLILPIILILIQVLNIQSEKNFTKQMMLSVAYGGNISGIGLLPAAIGNVLVVEIVHIYTGETISYFDWFMYAFPIWLLTIPTTWYVIYKLYPVKNIDFGNLKVELQKKIDALGPLKSGDKKCLIFLLVTVILWMTQGVHGMHPAVPALFAAVLMGLPKLGISKWENISKIDFNTMIMVGATLSIGKVLNDTGSISYLTNILFTDWFLSALINPFFAVIFIVIIVQIFHLGVSNVGTAVITIVPVFVTIAMQISVDPVAFAVISGITSLLGFILVVETIPNVIAHSTKFVTQSDFYKPGIILTLLTTVIIVFVVMTYWQWLGVY